VRSSLAASGDARTPESRNFWARRGRSSPNRRATRATSSRDSVALPSSPATSTGSGLTEYTVDGTVGLATAVIGRMRAYGDVIWDQEPPATRGQSGLQAARGKAWEDRDMATNTERALDRRVNILFRTSEEGRAELRARAAAHGVTLQTYLESVAFGRPLGTDRHGGRPPQSQEELPLTG